MKRDKTVETTNGWEWDDPIPCDKLLLAQVKRAKEEEEAALQMQGITKQSCLNRITDWGRLNLG